MSERRPRDEVPRPLKVSAEIAWRALVVAVAVVALALIAAKLRTVVLPILVALFLATLLYPLVRWMRGRGVPDGLAALAAVVLGLAVLAAAVTVVVRPVAADIG